MDREKAIQILKRCEAESHCEHYKRHYCCIGCDQREALDLAIEALKESQTTHDQMDACFMAQKGALEKLQLSGETSTVSEKESVEGVAESATTTDCSVTHDKRTETHGVCLDCISREFALEVISDYVNYPTEGDKTCAIKNAPSVTPTERTTKTMIVDGEETEIDPVSYEIGYSHGQVAERTGEWVFRTDIPICDGACSAGYICSICGEDYFKVDRYNYCPNCGAKMGGDTE